MRTFFLIAALAAGSCATSKWTRPVRDARDSGLTRVTIGYLPPGWTVTTECDLEFFPFCNTYVRSDDGRSNITTALIAPARGSALEEAYENYYFEWTYAAEIDPPHVTRVERLFGPPDWEATLRWLGRRTFYDDPRENVCVFRPLEDRAGLAFRTCGSWQPSELARYYDDFRSIEHSAKLSH